MAEELATQDQIQAALLGGHQHAPVTGYVRAQAGASPASPPALTGATFGAAGSVIVDPGASYNATSQRNNTRRLVDEINALRAQNEAMRAALVAAGLWPS
jgi:hypothetical protein